MSAEKSDHDIFFKEYEYSNIALRIVLIFLLLTLGISFVLVGIGSTFSLIFKAILSSLIFVLIWVILGTYLLRGYLKYRESDDTTLLPKENKVRLSFWVLILSLFSYIVCFFLCGLSFVFELLIQLSLLMLFINKMVDKQVKKK